MPNIPLEAFPELQDLWGQIDGALSSSAVDLVQAPQHAYSFTNTDGVLTVTFNPVGGQGFDVVVRCNVSRGPRTTSYFIDLHAIPSKVARTIQGMINRTRYVSEQGNQRASSLVTCRDITEKTGVTCHDIRRNRSGAIATVTLDVEVLRRLGYFLEVRGTTSSNNPSVWDHLTDDDQ